MVDLAGYLSLIPIFVLYNYVERNHSGYVALIATVFAFLPIAAVWRHYYGKFSGNQ